MNWEFLKFLFPGFMVIGALGSFVYEILTEGFNATALQWISAAGLYTALLLRQSR